MDQPMATPPENAPAEARKPLKIPDMRVVTKGWWVLREERVSVEELERQDREERQRKAKRGR